MIKERVRPRTSDLVQSKLAWFLDRLLRFLAA